MTHLPFEGRLEDRNSGNWYARGVEIIFVTAVHDAGMTVVEPEEHAAHGALKHLCDWFDVCFIDFNGHRALDQLNRKHHPELLPSA